MLLNDFALALLLFFKLCLEYRLGNLERPGFTFLIRPVLLHLLKIIAFFFQLCLLLLKGQLHLLVGITLLPELFFQYFYDIPDLLVRLLFFPELHF